MKMDIEKQLGAIEKSHQEDADKLHQMMMDRCIPVAKEVLKIIVDRDLEIGDKIIPRDPFGKAQKLNESNRPESYKEAAVEIQKLMLSHDLLWAERELIFMLVKQPMDMLQNIVLGDMETSYQRGICNLFGIEVLGEQSLSMIDQMLKKAKSLGKIMSEKSIEQLEELAGVAPVVPVESAPEVPEGKVVEPEISQKVSEVEAAPEVKVEGTSTDSSVSVAPVEPPVEPSISIGGSSLNIG